MATPNTASSSNEDTRPYIYECKLILLGADGVGKTSLMEKFVNNTFNEYLSSTLGAVFLTHMVVVDERHVIFQLCDTPGNYRYEYRIPNYYRDAQAVIVMYDITNMETFTKAKSWVTELQREASPNIAIALSGNKADLDDKREVEFEEAYVYAEKNGVLFMETSATIPMNTTEIFVAVAMKICKTMQEAADKESNTILLHLASQNGHDHVVKMLLKSGANVNVATYYGNITALSVACQNGHHDVVQSLLSAGADVNIARSRDGWSPLMIASQNGHYDIVLTLIGAGAEVNYTDKDRKKALDFAAKNGHKDVVQLLKACQTKVFCIMAQQFHEMYEEKEQQLHDIRRQNDETREQLCKCKENLLKLLRHKYELEQQTEPLKKQLCDMRQNKDQAEQQLHEMSQQKEQAEKQLCDMMQHKEKTELQLHDMSQQKEEAEQQIRDMKQQKEQAEQQIQDMRQQKCNMKEQIDAYEKRLQATESMLVKMQLKNKSLKLKLSTIVQQADTGQITQTTNFMDYSVEDPSVSESSSDDENEHP